MSGCEVNKPDEHHHKLYTFSISWKTACYYFKKVEEKKERFSTHEWFIFLMQFSALEGYVNYILKEFYLDDYKKSFDEKLGILWRINALYKKLFSSDIPNSLTKDIKDLKKFRDDFAHSNYFEETKPQEGLDNVFELEKYATLTKMSSNFTEIERFALSIHNRLKKIKSIEYQLYHFPNPLEIASRTSSSF